MQSFIVWISEHEQSSSLCIRLNTAASRVAAGWVGGWRHLTGGGFPGKVVGELLLAHLGKGHPSERFGRTMHAAPGWYGPAGTAAGWGSGQPAPCSALPCALLSGALPRLLQVFVIMAPVCATRRKCALNLITDWQEMEGMVAAAVGRGEQRPPYDNLHTMRGGDAGLRGGGLLAGRAQPPV